MSLIILANDFLPSVGGIQRYLYELTVALDRQGVELVVIAREQAGARAFDAAAPISIRRVEASSKLQAARALAKAATEQLNRGEAGEAVTAVVAGNWWPDGLAAWLLRRRSGIPYVVMGYGRETVQTGANVLKWLMQRLIIGGAAGGLAISHYSASRLRRRGLPEEQIDVIYGGVNPARFGTDDKQIGQLRADLSKESRPVLLTVGRLVERKGHSQVIAALQKVTEQLGPVRYVIVGSGPQEKALHRVANQYDVSEAVEFLGQVDEKKLSAVYRAADLFIMPSRDLYGQPIEGLGLVYLEANLCGLPVIASNTGGIPDAVISGETGLLVDPEDTTEIAEAIIFLLSNKAAADRMGAAGHTRVRREFTWGRVAERLQAALARWGLADDWPPEAA